MAAPSPMPGIPAIANPTATVASLMHTVLQLKQAVEQIAGERGNTYSRAVTFTDLLDLGVVAKPSLLSDSGKALVVGPVGYSQLPSGVQEVAIWGFVQGAVPAATRVLVMPVVSKLLIPANLAGSAGYAFGAPTGAKTVTLAYLRSGSPTTVGALSWAVSAHAATLPTSAAVALIPGDTLYATTSGGADATWADMGFSLLLKRNDS